MIFSLKFSNKSDYFIIFPASEHTPDDRAKPTEYFFKFFPSFLLTTYNGY